MAICEAAGVPYQFQKSQSMAGDVCRQFVAPVSVSGTSAKQALMSLLGPLGVQYEIDDIGLFLKK
jgi:hypothetical protein